MRMRQGCREVRSGAGTKESGTSLLLFTVSNESKVSEYFKVSKVSKVSKVVWMVCRSPRVSFPFFLTSRALEGLERV